MYDKVTYEVLTGVSPDTLTLEETDVADNPEEIDRIDDFAMRIVGEHIADGVSAPHAIRVTVNGGGESVTLMAQLDWVG